MSGLSRTPGKRVWVYAHRGFESRLLRQRYNIFTVPTAQNACTKNELTPTTSLAAGRFVNRYWQNQQRLASLFRVDYFRVGHTY